MFQKQCDALKEALDDPSPHVRVAAVMGVCRVLGLYWELVPVKTTQQLLVQIVNDLSRDASRFGVGVRVTGYGLRVTGYGLRVKGYAFMGYGLWVIWVIWVILSYHGVSVYGLWFMGSGFGFGIGFGLWVMGYGLWVMGYGLWVMGYGLGFGFWVLGFGFWVWVILGLGYFGLWVMGLWVSLRTKPTSQS